MKVLFKATQCNSCLWIEFNPYKSYLDVIQEVQTSKINRLTNELKAKEFSHLDFQLAAYLFNLEPYKIWQVNYFLFQDNKDKNRVSFLLETYEEWALKNTSIFTIGFWYSQQNNKTFWEKILKHSQEF